MNEATGSSGKVSTTILYTEDVTISCTIRKATSAPLYKNSLVGGTITSNGFGTTVYMIKDE